MSNLTLNLDSDALREATVQAIAGFLTPEVKEQILAQAIENLLRPSTNSWDRGKSPIESAFDAAVIKYAQQAAAELLAQDETIKTKIKELMRQTTEKVLSMDVDKMASRMADAFVSSIRKD